MTLTDGSSPMDRRRFVALAAGGALVTALPVPAVAQARRLGRIEYGVASVDPIWSMSFVALRKGFFEEEGLETKYIDAQSGPRAKQMLAAGQVFAATTGTNDSIALTLAGKPSVLVIGLDNRVTFANILVNKELYDSGKVRKLADLAGQNLAVTQPQAATWLMAVYILDQAGVKDKVSIRGLGDFVTMMGAVKTKQVAATMATFSMIDKAREEGWGVPLFDVTAEEQWNSVFGGDVPGTGCYILADTIKRRPELVQAFVNGIVKATDFVKNHSPEEITEVVYETYLSGFPKESVVKGIRLYKKSWSYSNLITAESYGRLVKIMGGGRQYSDDELKRVPYDVSVDMSFLKKARRLS